MKRVRVERCLLLPNIPAGMNPLVLMSLTYMLRSSHEDPPPITVRKEGRFYRILDGRHRFMAAVIAGRHDVLAVVEPAADMGVSKQKDQQLAGIG